MLLDIGQKHKLTGSAGAGEGELRHVQHSSTRERTGKERLSLPRKIPVKTEAPSLRRAAGNG